MTSPATNPGTVARGAVYRCTACGVELRHEYSVTGLLVIHPGFCPGVTLELFRDDRAGVTLPTAIQPVGGDQLEPGRVGQVEGESDAGGCGHSDNIATGGAERTANRCSPDAHACAEVQP